MNACENCGKAVRKPGLSQVAWGGMFCSLACTHKVVGEREQSRIEKENEIRRRVQIERAEIEKRMHRESEERARQERIRRLTA